MITMKIQITPEMRIRMMHAETIEIDVPDTQAELVGQLRQQLRQTSDSLNDKIVTMQAAVIDAKQNGPAAGMRWIANTLWGPGLIPDESEAWVNNAQHYYSHNCSNPLGPCGVCGAPSSVASYGHVACCMEHHKQLKGGAA